MKVLPLAALVAGQSPADLGEGAIRSARDMTCLPNPDFSPLFCGTG
jgi:hypothetical protein